jgi:hypothetical protein
LEIEFVPGAKKRVYSKIIRNPVSVELAGLLVGAGDGT